MVKLARYKVYQNDIGTIAVIKDWMIVFIASAFFLWGMFVLMLPDIWSVLSIWALMSNLYVYYPVLIVVLVVSFYLAFQINRRLVMRRTNKLTIEGFKLIEEITARSEKEAVTFLFPYKQFESPNIGAFGIMGCAFIFCLLLLVNGYALFIGLNKLITPSIGVQAKVEQESYYKKSSRQSPSYYILSVIFNHDKKDYHARVVSYSFYEIGSTIIIRCYKKDLNNAHSKPIQPWKTMGSGFLFSVTCLICYMIVLRVLMLVQRRKIVSNIEYY